MVKSLGRIMTAIVSYGMRVCLPTLVFIQNEGGQSEMTITYDWDKDKITSLPLGEKMSKLVKIGTQAFNSPFPTNETFTAQVLRQKAQAISQ